MYTVGEFLEKVRESDNKIMCFGTGLMAEEVLKYAVIKERVTSFIDNDTFKQGKRIVLGGQEYDVISPTEAVEHLDEKTIILLASGYYKEMEKQLRELGMPETTAVYSYPVMKVSYTVESEAFFMARILEECMREYEVVLAQYHITGRERERMLEQKRQYIQGTDKDDRPFVVPRIMIMPTTRCNMRCKGCSSLLPYFTKAEDISLEQIIRDFEIFFSGVDECIRITVGGEPFMYPHLKEVLEYLIAQQKVLGIMMITNSTIIPKDEILELVKNPKVFVEISDYGHLEKMGRLIQVFEQKGVNFIVLTEQTWTDMGGIECRGRSAEELRIQYLNCEQGRVIKGMHNGSFYTCARSARMVALGAYSSEKDYFELKEEEMGAVTREKLRNMYYSETADSCNHCDLAVLPTKVIEAGIQMHGNMQKSAYTIVKREEYEELKRLAQVKSRK